MSTEDGRLKNDIHRFFYCMTNRPLHPRTEIQTENWKYTRAWTTFNDVLSLNDF